VRLHQGAPVWWEVEVTVARRGNERSIRTSRLAVVLRVLSIGSWVVVVGGAGVGLIARTRVGETQVQNILLVVLATFFALVLAQLLLAAARAVPARRAALLALVAGVSLWAAGSATLTAGEGIGVQAFPDPSEASFLASYVGLAAYLLLDVARPRVRTVAVWLEAVVVCGGGVCVASFVLLSPVATLVGGGGLGLLLALLYPIIDLLLGTLVLGQALMHQRDFGPRTAALAGGFVLLAVADSSFLLVGGADVYVHSVELDTAYGASFALLATAATARRSRGAERTVNERSWALVAAAAIALTVLVLRPAGEVGWYVTVPAVITLVAAGVRLSLALSEARGAAHALLLSRTDELTGLANRRAVLTDLGERLRGTETFALLLLDLDGFKEINDSLGHAAGDAVLQTVATRLTATLSSTAVVARLGGDEFAMLVREHDPVTLVEAAQTIREELLVPVKVDKLELGIRASIGIAVRAPADIAPTDLLRRADVAMYEAKLSRASALLYDPARDDFSRQRLRLAEDLRRGITEGQLRVWYQPQVAARTRQVVSVEALVRWQHPVLGLLQPAAFLPDARRSGLMPALSEAVLRQVVADAVQWRAGGFAFRVAVNCAPPELLGTTLLPTLYEVLAASGLPPGALLVEVTEDSFVSEPERARELLLELRSRHVEVAIDDYGTGFSSLAYLRDLPVQELKVDRSFVDTVLSDPRSRVIVDSTTQMAHAMGLRLVAEGVEDEATAEALTGMGVDLLQGYHVARPMPSDQVADWVRERSVPQQSGPRLLRGVAR